MTVPTHHLRAILDAFERREIGITKIAVDGQNIAASGGGLHLEHFATGTFRAIVNRRSVRIIGEGDSAELAIAAAVAEARAVADEVASVLTALPQETP